MRKFAFVVAASLAVAVPLTVSVSTDAFAAKAKAKAKVEAPRPNAAFLRALGDLAASLSRPHPGIVLREKAGKGKVRTAKR